MKIPVLLITLLLHLSGAFCQVISVNNMLDVLSLSPARSEKYFVQKGFVSAGTSLLEDMRGQGYLYKGKNKRSEADTVKRSISRHYNETEVVVLYKTSSLLEFMTIKNELKEAGFVYNTSADSGSVLYQKRDITVHASAQIDEEGNASYNFRVQKKLLPAAKDIFYAEHLLDFTSHENIVHVFGENNVKKDVYYFSENEFSRCSVLFPNTDRQAVFIWTDEVNDCELSQILFGGQLTVQGALNFDHTVAENKWWLKSGVHAGMSLRELQQLNRGDFRFYGGNSAYTGLVIHDANAQLDFKNETVVLACLNCQNSRFSDTDVMSADEAIQDGRRFFVFSIILNPASASIATQQSTVKNR
jgi:hypothetical protein